MASASPTTLPELLQCRSQYSPADHASINFLDSAGEVESTFTPAELLEDATLYARRLLAVGFTSSSSVVLACFPDHRSHIRLFWACVLAGIPFCPLPALHPDPSRQTLLFEHLQSLFGAPTLVATSETIDGVKKLVPSLQTLDPECLPEAVDADVNLVFPAMRPAPEDTVCYMLTSGSTGNSKAVIQNHATLLSSSRGKKGHHGSTDASQFLNWIAFDHVACVSEIHIHALLSNARQYHVAPPAIVRAPLNLLKWSSKYRITYTFSPNFLIAQLLRDLGLPTTSITSEPSPKLDVDLSSLVALISGGESVPMATAIVFANLLSAHGANRNVLRAGFGMSETGAGCIYDRLDIPTEFTPELPAYLSLGTCCSGITMRVADAEGKILTVGEPGYLQVSGTSVFKGYFNNVQANEESFTSDGWFITGDLAQIDESQRLHLVGREKDFININGVKHLSLDVQQYVQDQKIEGVTFGHIFVCPLRFEGADTETYGVFYQHAVVVEDEAALQANRKEIRKANARVKQACTIFASQAPHVVLPLPRTSFVKTALGKISQSAMSKAYMRGDFKTIEETLADRAEDFQDTEEVLKSHVELVVAASIADIFAIDPHALRRSQNVFDLGASSMHLLRLKHVLQDKLGLEDLPTIDMLQRPIIGELCDYLGAQLEGNTDAQKKMYEPVICFNAAGSKPPLFLVHPGVGEVLVFVALARQLALTDDRPVYTLRARGFDRGDEPFDSFDEMVQCYVAAIERTAPNGPYYLAGYSFGGAVAFSIGKALRAKGKQVDWLGILNLPPHIQFRMKELIWGEVLINITMFLSLIKSDKLDFMRKELAANFPEVAADDSAPSEPEKPIRWLFERCDQERLTELDLEMPAFVRWVKVAYYLNKTGRTFEPQGSIQGALTSVFCAIPLPSMGTREEFKRDRLSAWHDFSDKCELIDVDGEHYTMLSETHVASFAEHMRGAMARATRPVSLHSADSTQVSVEEKVVAASKADDLATPRTKAVLQLPMLGSNKKQPVDSRQQVNKFVSFVRRRLGFKRVSPTP